MFKKKKINSKTKNNIFIHIIGTFSIFLVFAIAFYTFKNIGNFDFGNNKTGVDTNASFDFSSFFAGLRGLTSDTIEVDNTEVKNPDDDKINILLIGKGGVGHEAPDLTDTLILASINKTYNTVSMLSIPRDLYVSYGNSSEGKINQIYALEKSRTGDNQKGVRTLEDTISKITGETIDYYIAIDFKGFEEFIDAIGGVEINVPKTLVDNQFPDGNWGYRTLIIKKGTWLFDGETALKYARSRHSTSDFDRSLRQQQIIASIKDKLASGGFLSKLSKVKKFYEIFQKYVETDLGLVEIIDLYNEIGDYSKYEILSFNLNDSCFYGDPMCQKGGFLYVPERELFGGASVLLPSGAYKGDISNYDALSKFMDLIFNKPNLYLENTQINIFNATKLRGVAGDIAMELKRYGFNIPEKDSIGNARDKTYTGSIIYYSSDVEKTDTLLYLKNILGLESESRQQTLPLYSPDENTKLEIIVGEDYDKVLENLRNNL
ncbi:MAG: LCP family protein [Candidatus Gracilibacteria bacterium]|nr:LCP family protein [Candidatus Gracilibacteria bacterium]